MKTFLTSALATTILSFGTVLFGQTIVIPTYNAAQLAEIQDVANGNDMGSNVREMIAVVGPGESWIPLGHFSFATIHTLKVDLNGSGGNSSAITEFSTAWGGNHLVVHRLQKQNHQSHFRFYAKRDHPGTLVFLKHTNLAASSNTLKITYSSSQTDKWIAWSDRPISSTFDFTTLTDADEFVPALEIQSGFAYDGIELGAFINGQPIMTRTLGGSSSASSTGFGGGYNSTASGHRAIAYGHDNLAQGFAAAAFGQETKALANYSTSGGFDSYAEGQSSVAIGQNTKAYGLGSVAFGFQSVAGDSTKPVSDLRYATAFGRGTLASGIASTATGQYSKVFGDYSFAGGYASEAHNRMSFAFGRSAYARGGDSTDPQAHIHNSGAFAFGNYANANGESAFAAGTSANAGAPAAIAMGWAPEATANSAIAIGNSAIATAIHAISLGHGANANGVESIAMGLNSNASGLESVAIGYNNKATAQSAVALGRETLAEGQFSQSNGVKTIARDRAQFVVGQYNVPVGTATPKSPNGASALFIVGNGTNVTPSNALEVYQNGTTKVKGNLEVSGAITIEAQGDISMGIFE